MGIPELRPVIEACEEIIPLAKLAQNCYQQHGRPFKIAIDAADWHYHNVSPEQERYIKKMEPAAHPVEKAIFFRVCKLLTMNIRPVFVFDGPEDKLKPSSKGRLMKAGARAIIKEALKGLGVPHIDAPGEAEADCCKLQTLGLVDAVWSQDSDCLMFGCTVWIRELRTAREPGNNSRHIGDTQKDHKRVRVVRAENLKIEGVQLERDDFVLFAMLKGGDFDTQGLPGCGPKIALKLLGANLGRSLCSRKSQQECDMWREEVLRKVLERQSIDIAIPRTWPRFDILQKYNDPKTHSEESLRNNALTHSNYDQPPNEADLLHTACMYFNFWSKKYYNHIGPILLSRFLAERDRSLPHEVPHGIELVRTRTKKTDDGSQPIFMRKLTFSPLGLSILKNRQDFERLESTRPWKTDTSFNEDQRVTCEIPAVLLQDVLAPDVLEPPNAAAKKQQAKRKHQDDPGQQTDAPVKKRGRPRKADDTTGSSSAQASQSKTSHSTIPPRFPNTPGTPQKPGTLADMPIFLSDDEDEELQEAIQRSRQDFDRNLHIPPGSKSTPFLATTSGSSVITSHRVGLHTPVRTPHTTSLTPARRHVPVDWTSNDIDCIDLT
ncbi:XPG-I domain containing protein [Pyrenophora teres f. maculata]|nr:XPG-I domain containing protein [Pyrenophora teres f. maculata]